MGQYWQIGEYISGKLAAADSGEGVVESLALYLARTVSGLRGFSSPNLWRMRQFFETYRGNAKLSALVRDLPWTHNLVSPSSLKHRRLVPGRPLAVLGLSRRETPLRRWP